MGLKSLENAVFGLPECQNIGIDIFPASQLPKMAECSKKVYGPLLPRKSGSHYLKNVSGHHFAPRKGGVWVEVKMKEGSEEKLKVWWMRWKRKLHC